MQYACCMYVPQGLVPRTVVTLPVDRVNRGCIAGVCRVKYRSVTLALPGIPCVSSCVCSHSLLTLEFVWCTATTAIGLGARSVLSRVSVDSQHTTHDECPSLHGQIQGTLRLYCFGSCKVFYRRFRVACVYLSFIHALFIFISVLDCMFAYVIAGKGV